MHKAKPVSHSKNRPFSMAFQTGRRRRRLEQQEEEELLWLGESSDHYKQVENCSVRV
jgi:hypothetical protein